MFHFQLENHTINKIHFIGIGGVSMSGLAELLQAQGFEITGSDQTRSPFTDHLEKLGIPVAYQQGAENIQGQDLFVYTDAVPKDQAELVAAQKTGKPVLSRGQFLGSLMDNYPQSIAVSGSHGKSTTVSMLADIYKEAQVDTTILLGGNLDDIGGNVQVGHSDHLVAEACEYKNNIQYYLPHTAVVLNIDEDHLDFFSDLQAIIEAFEVFMDHLGEDDKAVINLDDPNCQTLPAHVKGDLVSFGIKNPEAKYRAENIHLDEKGHPAYDLRLPDGDTVPFKLGVLGEFNIYNALAATAAAMVNGLPVSACQEALKNYRNLHRRMEDLGTWRGAQVMTDYAHHPAEIQSTLKALRASKGQKIYCIFQPHTYTRTKSLMNRFAQSFTDCDEAIVIDILGVRELDDGSVSSQDLVDEINKHSKNARYIPNFEGVESYLTKKIQPGDTILAMGAGTINQLAEDLVKSGAEMGAC